MYQPVFTTVILSTGKTLTPFLTSGTPSVFQYIMQFPLWRSLSLLNEEHKFIAFVCTEQQMFFSSLSSNWVGHCVALHEKRKKKYIKKLTFLLSFHIALSWLL